MILLMEEILHQLIGSLSQYRVLYFPGGAGFLPSTVPRVWIFNNANWGLQCCRKSRPQITRPKCSSLGRFWTMRGARVCKKMIMISLIHYKLYINWARYTIYKADLLTYYNSCICISFCNTWIHWSECRRNIFPIASVFLNWLTRAMHGRIILHWWYNDYQWCRYDIYVYRSANCCTPPSNDNATPPRSLVVVEWVFLANSIRRNSNIATRGVVLEQLPGLAATMEGIRKGACT